MMRESYLIYITHNIQGDTRMLTQLRYATYGMPVQDKKTGKIIMRIRPTGFLLNSTLVSEVLSRGDTFIVDLEKGTLYCAAGDRNIDLIHSELKVKPYQKSPEQQELAL
jgi:hypothetical protein